MPAIRTRESQTLLILATSLVGALPWPHITLTSTQFQQPLQSPAQQPQSEHTPTNFFRFHQPQLPHAPPPKPRARRQNQPIHLPVELTPPSASPNSTHLELAPAAPAQDRRTYQKAWVEKMARRREPRRIHRAQPAFSCSRVPTAQHQRVRAAIKLKTVLMS